MERTATAISHQRTSSGAGLHQPSSSGDLLPEPLSSDLVAQLPQRVDPPSQLKQHPRLADRRLRVSLDAADTIRVKGSHKPSDNELHVLRDRQIRARESRNSGVLHEIC